MDRRLDIDPGGEYGDWRWTMTIMGGIDNGTVHVSGEGTGKFAFGGDRRGAVDSGQISVGEAVATTAPEGPSTHTRTG